VDPAIGMLAAVINRDGLDREGIFRLAGSSIVIRKLRADINSGRADVRTKDGYQLDIFAVAAVLKVGRSKIVRGVGDAPATASLVTSSLFVPAPYNCLSWRVISCHGVADCSPNTRHGCLGVPARHAGAAADN